MVWLLQFTHHCEYGAAIRYNLSVRERESATVALAGQKEASAAHLNNV